MWTLLLVTVLAAAPPEVEVQIFGGDAIRGSIVELNDEKVTLQTAAGQVSLEIDKLAAISPKGNGPAAQQPAVWVELVDGSLLVGQQYAVKDGQARLTTPEGTLELPTRDVLSVRLQAQTEATAPQWTRITEGNIDADLIVIRGDRSLDYHKGVLHDVAEQTVEFALEDEVLPVKRSKVYGLIYRHPEGRQLPEARCRLTDVAGSQWLVRSIVLEKDKLRWTTPAGLTASRLLASVARIDFSEGKIVFLSDLKPESVTWTPFFGAGQTLPALAEFYAPRQDRALGPKPLKLGGKQYAKGLALHSRTEMVFRLPRRFRRFVATVGIDDGVRPRGNVRLVIRGDDRVLLEKTIAGTDPPQPVDLDLSGVRRLAILVDFGEDLDVADHLDLCEARVIK